ncbi:hypothetical protein C7T79_15990 [Xanthomonas oryzae pv. oryzicola]|nr:hypothetical protein C7T79_15990 [Xanthomonas oryzae pv. oryzicola]
MTQAAVLPVVFDQVSPALPAVLAAPPVVSNARGTRSARRANAIAMAIQRHLSPQPSAATAQRSYGCTGMSAVCL